MDETARNAVEAHIQLATEIRDRVLPDIEEVAHRMIAAIGSGRTIYWCGNGGSAADSQHLAAELVGRFNLERSAMPSAALTTNTSTLTSIANDYGYEEIFSRQVEGLVRPDDILVGISTSGNSPNVMRAIDKAKSMGAYTVGLVGRDGGKMADACDKALTVPADDTARIQEMHILIGHVLCDMIERHFAAQQ